MINFLWLLHTESPLLFSKLKILLWISINGNVAFSPAVTQHDHWNRWKWTWWNNKIQQLFKNSIRTKETTAIRLEATKVLRADHTDFQQRPSLRFPASWRVWILGGDGCLLWVGWSYETTPQPLSVTTHNCSQPVCGASPSLTPKLLTSPPTAMGSSIITLFWPSDYLHPLSPLTVSAIN